MAPATSSTGRVADGVGVATPLSVGLLWLGILVLLAVRSWGAVSLPALSAEDGTKVFAYFFQNRGLSALFLPKGGYTTLVANAIGFTSVRLPPTWIPYALAWCPLLLASLAYSLLALPGFRSWIPSDSRRIGICLALAANPVGGSLLVANTDYSTWNTLWIFFLLSIVPLATRPVAKAAHVATLAILTWSHPMTILAAPFYVVNARSANREDRLIYVLQLVHLLLHQVYGTDPMLVRVTLARFSSIPISELVMLRGVDAVEIVMRRVFGRTFFGDSVVDSITNHYPAVLYVLAGAILLEVALHWDRAKRVAVPCLYVAAAITFSSLMSRWGYGVGAIGEKAPYAGRYGYLPSIAVTTLVVDRLADWALRRERILKAAVVGAAICWLGIRNTQELSTYEFSRSENGRIVRECFERLAEAGRTNAHGIVVRCEKVHGDWPFEVVTP